MRIVKFNAENIKRLHAVEITPDGNLVQITGKNGQGKSSVLDAIWMALGGSDKVPEVPIHTGETKGNIRLDLGEIVVRRTFSAAGSTLTVHNADGSKVTSPQRLLDALVGKMTFDPMQFMRMKPGDQAEMLRGLLGLDFAQSDERRKNLYDERTGVNRELKAIQARGEAITVPADAPDSEQSPTEILQKITAAETSNSRIYSAITTARENVEAHERAIVALQAAKDAVLVAERAVVDTGRHRDESNAYAISCGSIVDTAALRSQISDLERLNGAARAKKLFSDICADYEIKKAASDSLSQDIDSIDATKANALKNAAFPVPGLGFSETGGVTFNGLPITQASSAEQLRVSVAIAMAMNPKLRVLRISDGSLLDKDSLALIDAMATAGDYQVWIEMVDDSGQVGVVIHDGFVQEHS